MKRLLTGLLTVFLLALTSNIANAQQQKSADKPKILGVLMYADWCGKCKELDPKLSEVQPQFQGQPILFTRFDMTNDFTTTQSEKLAGLLGIGDLFQQHKGSTGYMVLLDTQTNEVLKTLKHNQSEQDLKQEIASVLSE
jgi:thiol-disulfide isomerase/thioredoxin